VNIEMSNRGKQALAITTTKSVLSL